MSEVWNRVYSSDNRFFGEEPSNFATLCLNHMKTNNVRRLLELGAGHGRDSILFASENIEVEALDYSSVGIDIINKLIAERKLPIHEQIFDVKKQLPFRDCSFDAVYSHMLLNMRFSIDEIQFIFSEIKRVLKPRGFNFFSVRNHNDKFYGKGSKQNNDIYDIDGFQVRFYTEQEIIELLPDFEILWIKEEYEDPVTLFLVSSRKT